MADALDRRHAGTQGRMNAVLQSASATSRRHSEPKVRHRGLSEMPPSVLGPNTPATDKVRERVAACCEQRRD